MGMLTLSFVICPVKLIKEAQETCKENPDKECAAAWDEVSTEVIPAFLFSTRKLSQVECYCSQVGYKLRVRPAPFLLIEKVVQELQWSNL